MSVHIEAKKGEIAKTILLPGDPLRAKWIAETFLEDPVCFNKVRGMFGFTGSYQGKLVSWELVWVCLLYQFMLTNSLQSMALKI